MCVKVNSNYNLIKEIDNDYDLLSDLNNGDNVYKKFWFWFMILEKQFFIF